MTSEHRMTVGARLSLLGGLALCCLLTLAAVALLHGTAGPRAYVPAREGSVAASIVIERIDWLLDKHRGTIAAAPLEFDPFRLAAASRTADEVMQRIEHLAARIGGEPSVAMSRALPRLREQGNEVLRLAGALDPEGALAVADRYGKGVGRLQAAIKSPRRDPISAVAQSGVWQSANASAGLKAVAVAAFVALLLIGALAAVQIKAVLAHLNRVTDLVVRLARNETDVQVDGLAEVGHAITVVKENTIRLHQVDGWLGIALGNMSRGLSMFDDQGRLLICNPAYRRMYALPDELTRPGTPFDRIVAHRLGLVTAIEGEEDKGPRAPALSGLLGQVAPGPLSQRTADGRIIEISAKPMPGGGWVALHEDVTERLAATELVERLVRRDSLTSLANRLTFLENLDRVTAELLTSEGFALLVIDLDRFKEINDTLGHPAGDAVLVAVGRRLTELAGRDDLVARLGSDEFGIIQHGVSDRSVASALAQQVIEALHVPFHIHGQRVPIGGTVGIALAPDDGRSASELMKHADLALYRAKLDRRGTTRFFDPAMERLMRLRRSLEADLAHAVARAELELHYQPIVSLDERRVTGCEALIRWRHPERGVVSPGEFIPLAEESGLICGIGAWALGEACQAAARWPGELCVAVNLSVAQFAGPDLATITANALGASGLAPRRLELEVTESLLLGDDPATLELLHRLRDLGLGIALDDFGTGYSSLSHLRSFPFDKIKIDQSFVRDLPQMKNCEAIVGAVARLASSLDMTTVAEGVESEEHLSRVEAAGCDAVQGYLFSRPVAEDRLFAVIAEIDARLATQVGSRPKPSAAI